jgi:hypothetical protein
MNEIYESIEISDHHSALWTTDRIQYEDYNNLFYSIIRDKLSSANQSLYGEERRDNAVSWDQGETKLIPKVNQPD